MSFSMNIDGNFDKPVVIDKSTTPLLCPNMKIKSLFQSFRNSIITVGIKGQLFTEFVKMLYENMKRIRRNVTLMFNNACTFP